MHNRGQLWVIRSPTRLVLAACLVETLGMAAFATFPTLIPAFRTQWAINNTEAGWISGVFFIGYLVAVAILTALTDRVSAKRIYLLSMALSAVAAAGFAFSAEGVWSASFWRMLQGIGLAGTYMPGLKALTDQLPERAHGRGTAFYTASFGIGTSLSYYLSGLLYDAVGWQWTFALCALGPLLALMLAAFVFESRRPPAEKPNTRLLDFRPVMRNRAALGFALAYSVHNAELFAFRSWVVAFLVFSQSLQPPGAMWVAVSAASLAALINLVGVPSSILGNELAGRVGRQRAAIGVMCASAAIGLGFGFFAASPFWLVVILAFGFGITITGESATLTAGLLKSAEPRYRGTTMAMHSLVGFVGAFAGPLAFGLVLDLAGGESRTEAWGSAFAAIGLLMLLGPAAIARFVGLRTKHH